MMEISENHVSGGFEINGGEVFPISERQQFEERIPSDQCKVVREESAFQFLFLVTLHSVTHLKTKSFAAMLLPKLLGLRVS